MRALICPDKFKGTLSAREASEAIRAGMAAVWPEAALETKPVADGGEGTAEAVLAALGGSWVERAALDPLGRLRDARFAWFPATAGGRTAVIDMSEASGLWRLGDGERDPLRASTFGTGQLLREAAACGAERIVLGLGGSATNDGGAGMAAALGYVFLDARGAIVPPRPERLGEIAAIRADGAARLPPVIAATDVTHPLLGDPGATAVFGPQKGADGETRPVLEAGLERLAEAAARDLGVDPRETPGAGAAGGLGFGVMAFCGGELTPGFPYVAEIVGLEASMRACDWAVTGEGTFDRQSLEGKATGGIAEMARRSRKPVALLAGEIESGADAAFDFAADLRSRCADAEEARREAASVLRAGAEAMAREIGEAAGG